MGNGPLCENCALHHLGTGFTEVLVGKRYEQAKVLLIGEASGANEAREGLPFRPHAQAGSMLYKALRDVNLSIEDVAVTNICRCHPPGDAWDGAWYQQNATMHCLENYLKDAIKTLAPRIILALGGSAYRALTIAPKGRYGTIDYTRGYSQRGAGVAEGVPVIATYHPAFVRRGMAHLTPLVQRDIRRAYLIGSGRLVEGVHYALDPYSLPLRYQTSPSLAEAWEWARNINPDLPLSWDLETPYSTREDEDDRANTADRDINLFQATQRRGEGIALPYRDEYIEVVKFILASPTRKVGFNNWIYDDGVAGANDVYVNVEKGNDDAMIMFGRHNPDLPANLQAAAQYCGFPFMWKHLNESDQAFYGVADVDAALCVWETMNSSLRKEGLYDAYVKFFAQLYPVLKRMAARGIPVTARRREVLGRVIDSRQKSNKIEIQSLVPKEVFAQKQKYGFKNPPLLKCEDCGERFRVDHFCNRKQEDEEGIVTDITIHVPYADLAEENGLVLREIVVPEDTKCRCTKKTRGECAVCAGSGIIPAGLCEMRWAALMEFNPNSSHQVKRFMRYMKHPIPKHQKRMDKVTGEASETTEVKELERLFTKTKHNIYPLMIERRQLTKMKGTYYEGFRPTKAGYVHYTPTYRPATWQTSSKDVNAQNQPKRGRTKFQKTLVNAFRRMIEAKEGKILINADWKAFHALTTGFEAQSPLYMRLARNDMHSFVACHWMKLPERHGLLNRDDEDMMALFAWLRANHPGFDETRGTKTKPVGLGIGFGQRAKSIFEQRREDFNSVKEVQAIWELMMVDLFPDVSRWQKMQIEKAADQGYLISKHGAVRRFHDAMRWDHKSQKFVNGDQAEAAIAFEPANDAFGHARQVILNIAEKGFDEKFGLFNNVHDSLEFHCPIELMEECKVEIGKEMRVRSTVLVHPKIAPDGFWADVDFAHGKNMKDMH